MIFISKKICLHLVRLVPQRSQAPGMQITILDVGLRTQIVWKTSRGVRAHQVRAVADTTCLSAPDSTGRQDYYHPQYDHKWETYPEHFPMGSKVIRCYNPSLVG